MSMRHLCTPLTKPATLLNIVPRPTSAQGSSDMVRIVSEHDCKEIEGSSAITLTQIKTLPIALNGKRKPPEIRTPKRNACDRILESDDIAIIDLSAFKTDLPTGGQPTIKLKEMTTTTTLRHAVASRDRSWGGLGSSPRAKEVEAERAEYTGCGVIVLEGGRVVGDTLAPMEPKAEVNK